MKTTRIRSLLALLAVAGFATAPGFSPTAFGAPETQSVARTDKVATDFANILPADDTACVFLVRDFFKYAAFDAKTPMARLLAHPAVRQWTETFVTMKQEKIAPLKAALGLSEKDFARLFTGKAVVALLLEKKEIVAEGPDGKATKTDLSVQPVVMAEFKSSAQEYERLFGKLESHIRERDKTADIARVREEGLAIHAYEVDGAEWGFAEKRVRIFHTLHDGMMVVAGKKDRLLDAVRALSRGAARNPLSGRSDFIAVKKEMGECDGFFYANLASLMPYADERLRETIAEEGASNPMIKAMLAPETVAGALALRNFNALYGSFRLNESRIEARYGLTWKDRSGVASLFAFGKAPVVVPAFVSADYKGLDATTMDFASMIDAGTKLVRDASPAGYAMLNLAIAQKPDVEKALTALRTGVVDNIRPNFVSVTGYAKSTPSADELPGKAWIFQLKDPVAAQNAIESVLALKKDEYGAPVIDPVSREYLGVRIYSLPEIPSPFSVKVRVENSENMGTPETLRCSYAFVGEQLIIALGDDAIVEGVIANMKNPGKALINERFASELGEIPGTPCGVSYGDIGTYLKSALIGIHRNGDGARAAISEADFVKLRDACASLRYYWAGKTFFNADGVYGRLLIAEQPDAAK